MARRVTSPSIQRPRSSTRGATRNASTASEPFLKVKTIHMWCRYMTVEEAAMMYYGEDLGPDGMDYDMGSELGALILAISLNLS